MRAPGFIVLLVFNITTPRRSDYLYDAEPIIIYITVYCFSALQIYNIKMPHLRDAAASRWFTADGIASFSIPIWFIGL